MPEILITPQTHEPTSDTAPPLSHPRDAGPFIKGTYVSGDEFRRLDARAMGYEVVCQHPNEVGVLGRDDELIIDLDYVLFGDFDTVLRVATEAARNGVTGGVHAYNLEHPALAPLALLPGITVAKTHRALRAAM